MADDVVARGIVPQKKIRVIPNGIELSRFRQPRDKAALREFDLGRKEHDSPKKRLPERRRERNLV